MEIYGQTQNQSFGQMPQQNMVQNSMPMQQPGMMQRRLNLQKILF